MTWPNDDQDRYEQGKEDGENSNILDDFCQSISESIGGSDSYDRGFHDGVDEKDK